MQWTFECPYLGDEVDFTEERQSHVRLRHRPIVVAGMHEHVGSALRDPDSVARSIHSPLERPFFRAAGQQTTVVVVISERAPASGGRLRHWVVTAYLSRTISERWVIEWEKR